MHISPPWIQSGYLTSVVSASLLICTILLTAAGCAEEKPTQPQPAGKGTIAGKVRNRQTNAPLSGASISTVPPTQTVTTNAQGIYILTGLAAGEYEVKVTMQNYVQRSVIVTALDDSVVVADVALSMRGVVTEAGLALETNMNVPADSVVDYRGCLTVDEYHGLETLSGNSFTIEAWCKPAKIELADTARNEHWILHRGNEQHREVDYLLGIVKGKFQFITRDRHYVLEGTETPVVGEWYHLAAVYDHPAREMRLYINSRLDARDTVGPESFGNYSADLFIGCRNGTGKGFIGCIDEVRFWTVARTSEQIQANYRSIIDSTSPGLEMYWRFDREAVPDVVVDVAGNRYGSVNQYARFVPSEIPLL